MSAKFRTRLCRIEIEKKKENRIRKVKFAKYIRHCAKHDHMLDVELSSAIYEPISVSAKFRN